MTVVEVGPVTVRGPAPVDDELATAAIESIDDMLMLVADRPATVRTVMADLVTAAAGPGDDELVVVHPSWWSRPRVETLRDVAADLPRTASLVTRSAALGGASTTVVEIAVEHVAITSADVCTLTRTTDEAVCAAVLDDTEFSATVVVDTPPGVRGGGLASSLMAALRAHGAAVTRTGAQPLRIAAPPPPVTVIPSPRRRRRAAPMLAGVLLAAVGGGAAAITHDPSTASVGPTTLLVEGRAGVVVPALWSVHRITDGGGSARVQITSPADRTLALHVTQSALAHPQSPEQVADTLRDALVGEPAGIFTDFRAADVRGGRTVATYRERRPAHETDWAVLADGTLRIGIGCQSPPGRADAIRSVCEAAVRSAHAVIATKSPDHGTG